MIDLRVEILQRQQVALLRALDGRKVAFAEVQALNRTRNNVQTTGLKAIAKAMGIKVSQLRKRGRIVDASRSRGKYGVLAKGRNASRRRLETSVVGRGRPFNVTRFGAKAVKVGKRTVAVTHEAYGREQTAERTWQLNSGAVVVRSGNSFRGVYGPGVAQLMERRDIREKMEREAAERFPGHFKSAIEFAFSRSAPAFLR